MHTEIGDLDRLSLDVQETEDLLLLASADSDVEMLDELADTVNVLAGRMQALEFRRMFVHPEDPNNAYLEIQAGVGGVDAQDWAEMLLRMYRRWGERHGYDVHVNELVEADVAGLRRCTMHCVGAYAYGWLRTEEGVHRLVRRSPFNTAKSRETSFAKVSVYPEVDDKIVVDLDMTDVRIDTYRASGAGGQHVNKTDSAIRLTHLPTGIVVQCQNERSQHKNKAEAIKQLRGKLYEKEEGSRREERQRQWENGPDIGWGNQIRSYVLDQSRVKDTRTGVESSDPFAVLDGDFDKFIEASLKQGH